MWLKKINRDSATVVDQIKSFCPNSEHKNGSDNAVSPYASDGRIFSFSHLNNYFLYHSTVPLGFKPLLLHLMSPGKITPSVISGVRTRVDIILQI